MHSSPHFPPRIAVIERTAVSASAGGGGWAGVVMARFRMSRRMAGSCVRANGHAPIDMRPAGWTASRLCLPFRRSAGRVPALPVSNLGTKVQGWVD